MAKTQDDELIADIVKILAWLVASVGKLLWHYPLEVGLVVVMAATAQTSLWYPFGVAVAWLVAIAIPATRPYLLIDLYRAKRRAGRARANRFLTEDKLLPPLDKGLYKAWVERHDDRVVLSANVNDLPGITASKLSDYCDTFKSEFGAVLTSTDTKQDGRVEVSFWPSDPLDVPLERHSVDDCQTGFGVFYPCIDVTGKAQPIKMANASGVLVGGQAGSGKSASMVAGLVPYVVKGKQSGQVELFGVVDGKGGADWRFLDGLSRHRVVVETGSEIQFLTEVRDMFVTLTTEMKDRYEKLRATGTQNYWDDPQCQHLLVIVDECQTLFETPIDKEAKPLVAEITSLVASLLKRGRAAAITLVLMTQKCDASSVPTKIRDMCAVRIGFSVANRTNSEMIFGHLRDDGFYPHEIGRNPGVAVIEDDTGQSQRVRFGYVSMENAKEWVKNV